MKISKKLIAIFLVMSFVISTSATVSAETKEVSTENSSSQLVFNKEISDKEFDIFSSLPLESEVKDNNTTKNEDIVKKEENTQTNDGENILSKLKNIFTKIESEKVTVNQPVTSIVTSTKSIVLDNGQSRTIDIEINPSNASLTDVVWQSTNTNVAEVDELGTVVAKGAGTCTIKVYATDGSDKYGYCSVMVTQKVTDFEFVNLPQTLNVDESIAISTNINPSYATKKTLKWSSSNTDVATVSARGIVTAKNSGECTITATTTDGSDISKSFILNVNGNPKQFVTSLNVETMRKIISEEEQFSMNATVSPANATNKSLKYVSSNTNVATVDENGIVYGVSKGNCVIYVSTNDGSNLRTGCVVTVEKSVAKVNFYKHSIVCNSGKKVDLSPEIIPSNASTSSIVYKSSNSNIATVDNKGVVTAVSKGSCQILCTSKDGKVIYDICNFTVNQSVTLIKIYGYEKVTENQSIILTAKVSPTNADNKNVVWSSSNDKIAKVDQRGYVFGIKAGKVTITCKANDGSEIVATKEIMVYPPDVEELIRIAKQQVGNNATKYRTWFYGYDAKDVPWCAVFVSWCFGQIDGIGKYIEITDGAGSIARESIAEGLKGEWYESEYSDRTTNPQIGDVIEFVWNYEGRYYNHDIFYSDHVGIVYDVDDEYVYTVEGNSGATNDTSTVRLRSYSRTSGAINGYYRPDWSD